MHVAQTATRLRVADISKTFPGTKALTGASLDVAAGEIHALVGGNGSGKSTLIKILAGVYAADPGGKITVEDRSVAAHEVTPQWSAEAHLAFVHQDLGLFDQLSVAENLFVGLPYPRRLGAIDWQRLNAEASSILARLGVAVSPDAPVGGLRAADRTLVAVGRALRDREDVHDGVLVLDEPSARLPATEVDRLLETLTRLAAEGQSILYVSHRLDEILTVSQRTTVLRDGSVVARRATDELDVGELSRLIAGDTVSAAAAPTDIVVGSPMLEVRDLWAGPLRGVDVTVAAGEVLGVVGLVGAGASSLLRAVYGAQPRRGTVRLDGHELAAGNVAAAVRAGAALVPDDRLRHGAFASLSVRENLSASYLARFRNRWACVDRRAEHDASARAVDIFSVRCPSPHVTLALLSGGNQQKVVMARWLSGEPRLLLLDEPTQGVDVGARAEIHRQIRDAARRGCAVLVASSDANELLDLSDRVIVLRGGLVATTADRHEVDRHWIARQVFGRDYLEEPTA